MSTKKAVRADKAASELKEKSMGAVTKLGLMGALLAALSGPLPAIPIEDPRKPRDPAAWAPTPAAKKRKEGGEPPPSRRKPIVYQTEGAGGQTDPNLYLRSVGEGNKEVLQFGNRLKDRRRKLEQLLTMVGVKPTPRQVRKCQKGLFPAPLIRWLIAYKAWRERMEAAAEAPAESPAASSNAALADQLAATVAAAREEVETLVVGAPGVEPFPPATDTEERA